MEPDVGEHIDELDRQYYRQKLDELGWCLGVVRAAQALADAEAYDQGELTPAEAKLTAALNRLAAYYRELKR